MANMAGMAPVHGHLLGSVYGALHAAAALNLHDGREPNVAELIIRESGCQALVRSISKREARSTPFGAD